ncbi:ATP-binding protein [Saccharothrix lopnurensis]|uniref:ATP-binding protein n=1 Tax=Saccharothrix lopnurensis TaxID=1670621 RepID=A0ABW1P4Q4_9PSEU
MERPPDTADRVDNAVTATSVGAVAQVGVVHGEVHVHPRPAPAVPRQLPAAPHSFTGRARQLAELDRALGDPGSGSGDPAARSGGSAAVVISAIGGAGGIGKTWLALRWAHRLAERFPDGQLFVDLRGFSPTGAPVPPGAAVRGFLDALGVDPGRLPADLDAQAALYRTLVADKRVLVVLDNAADADQVAPLLPGGRSCAVLVTSRRKLTGLIARHDARHVDLDVLTEAEARALLERRLGAVRPAAEPGAVAELLALCRGFPLALGILAGRARTDPGLPLAQLVADLREFGVEALDDDDPTVSLPAVLATSYRALTAEQRVVFGLLGIAPGPGTGLAAAVSLTGLSAARAARVLRGLREVSLLERDAHDRYAMHDLIHSYAAGTAHRHLPAGVWEAALRRVLDFYLHTARAADHLLEPYRPAPRVGPPAAGVVPLALPDVPAALAWLDVEHAALLAAARAAADLGWHEHVGHFAWVLESFHLRRGHRHDALAVWRAALGAAAHVPEARAGAHKLLGHACARLGRHEEAVEHLHRALELAERDGDVDEQAYTLRLLGQAWGERGDDRRALEHARRALDLFRVLDLPVWEAAELNAVGWYSARLGDYGTAREHCRAALAVYRRHHYPAGEAGTLDSLGYVAHLGGCHEEAVGHYLRSLALYREHGDTYTTAVVLEHLGDARAALEQSGSAAAAWREALELYRGQGRDGDAERVRGRLDALDRAVGGGVDGAS